MATPPVKHDETLYRQIGPGGNPVYYADDRQPPVHHAVFLPSPDDTDGLSLIRSRHRSEVWAAFRPNRPEVRYRLAPSEARELAAHAERAGLPDLHFHASPDQLDEEYGEPWAHCVAAQINRDDYEKNKEAKKQIKQWARAVAASLSPDQIEGPFDPPSDADPYRP